MPFTVLQCVNKDIIIIIVYIYYVSLSTSFFSFITVIDYYQCDLIISHTICLINNYNTNIVCTIFSNNSISYVPL